MRLLVTRPGAAGERTAERLRALGHDVVASPVLLVAPTAEPPPPGPFDALVLTSANAVPFLPAILEGGPSPPVFAVGERTAAAAREAGIGRILVGGGDASVLAELVARTVSEGSRIFLIAGRDRKPEPERSLRAAGHAVAVWTAYEAGEASSLTAEAVEAIRSVGLDAALHYSRRSAAALVRLAAEAGLLSPFRMPAHLCLSADVAVPLREAAIPRLVVADRPDEDSLLRALALLSTSGPSR